MLGFGFAIMLTKALDAPPDGLSFSDSSIERFSPIAS
jgi:hypothetical protein